MGLGDILKNFERIKENDMYQHSSKPVHCQRHAGNHPVVQVPSSADHLTRATVSTAIVGNIRVLSLATAEAFLAHVFFFHRPGASKMHFNDSSFNYYARKLSFKQSKLVYFKVQCPSISEQIKQDRNHQQKNNKTKATTQQRYH